MSNVIFDFDADNSVLNVTLPTGNVTTDDLSPAIASLPSIMGQKVIISGRGPVWLLAAIALALKNNVATVATFDPKLGGGVVVHSINSAHPVGSIIPFALPLAAA